MTFKEGGKRRKYLHDDYLLASRKKERIFFFFLLLLTLFMSLHFSSNMQAYIHSTFIVPFYCSKLAMFVLSLTENTKSKLHGAV